MNNETAKQVIYLIVLGGSLVGYAYANFPTKSMITLLREDIKELRVELNDLRKIIYQKKR